MFFHFIFLSIFTILSPYYYINVFTINCETWNVHLWTIMTEAHDEITLYWTCIRSSHISHQSGTNDLLWQGLGLGLGLASVVPCASCVFLASTVLKFQWRWYGHGQVWISNRRHYRNTKSRSTGNSHLSMSSTNVNESPIEAINAHGTTETNPNPDVDPCCRK